MAEPAPIDAIVERIRAVPGVKVSGKGRRFVVKRGNDELRLAFASAARAVTIDDAILDGDGALAIDVLCALMPLVGALEVRIGEYVELIDGHEATAAVAARYDQYWIAETLRLAREMPTRDHHAGILRTAPTQRRDEVGVRRRMAIGYAIAAAFCLLLLATVNLNGC